MSPNEIPPITKEVLLQIIGQYEVDLRSAANHVAILQRQVMELQKQLLDLRANQSDAHAAGV